MSKIGFFVIAIVSCIYLYNPSTNDSKIHYEIISGYNIQSLESELTVDDYFEYAIEIVFVLDYHDSYFDSLNKDQNNYYVYNMHFYNNVDMMYDEVYISSYTPYLFYTINNYENVDFDFIYDIAEYNYVSSIYVRYMEINRNISVFIPPTDDDGGGGSTSPDYGLYDNFPLNHYYKGYGVKIGILDTGELNLLHQTFANRDVNIVLDTYSNTNIEGNPTYDYDHIMKVAAIICGADGYSRESSIYYVNMHSIEVPDLTGVEVLLNQDVDIINLSISYYSDNNYEMTSTYLYFDYIVSTNSDVIFVAASGNTLTDYKDVFGNYYDDFGYISIPANITSVIAVGSIDVNYVPSPFSSCYTKSIGNIIDSNIASKPEIVAVGGRRYIPFYGNVSGTSFSAPAVSSTVALLKQKFGDILNTQTALSIITATANSKDIDYSDLVINRFNLSPLIISNDKKTGHDMFTRTGAGALDVEKALSYPQHRLQSILPTLIDGQDMQIINILYLFEGQTFSFSLAWDRVSSIDSIFPMANLNLEITTFDGVSVYRTSARYGNLEIIKLHITSTGYYKVKIIGIDNAYSISSFNFAYDMR